MTYTAWVNVDHEVGHPTGTAIHYNLIADALVTLEIFDVLGNKVRTLVDSVAQDAGSYEVFWDGNDAQGQPVHDGNYLYRLRADALRKNWRFDFSRPFRIDEQQD